MKKKTKIIQKNTESQEQTLGAASKKGVLMKLMKYYKPYKGLLIITGFLIILSNTFILIGPYLSGKSIDSISEIQVGGSFHKVQTLCIIMVVFYILSSLLTFLISRIMIHIGKNIACTLREELQEHLLTLPVSFFDTKQAGDIISCFSYDIGVLNTSLTNDIIQIANSIITLIVSFIIMLWISPWLILVLSIPTACTLAAAKYRIKKVKPLFRRRAKKLGVLNGYAEELLSGVKTIIAYQQQETMIDRFAVTNEEASTTYFQADVQGSIMGCISLFISNLSLVLVGLVGSVFYMMQMITIGGLSSFILYSKKFTAPINELANISAEIQSALSAANRIFSLLEEAPEPLDQENAIELTDVKGSVSFSNVDFGYVPNKTILSDMNLSANPGQTIAIVGPTGAGKTTIINLLMRFYDYQDGNVTIDGHSLTAISRNSLRKSFSMVLQDTWIFKGTILENIAYIHQDATMDDIKRVAKAAKIDKFIDSLPNGYHTSITDEGSNISKGQKQLISIARAMLVDAPMLILDEATSNIDSATEILVQEAMANLMKDKTCFVIAHRLSTIQHADKILVIGNGKIMEQGTHQELLDQKGHYHTMYYSQFV